MAKVTKNLGLVKAIFVGEDPPVNTDVLWRDTSLVVPIHKYYNEVSGEWMALINSVTIDNHTIKKDVFDRLYVDTSILDITYRMNQVNVDGNTVITFSSSMPNLNYYVDILSYVSDSGVIVGSGYSANSNNTLNGFTFIPPVKFPKGVLVYVAKLFK